MAVDVPDQPVSIDGVGVFRGVVALATIGIGSSILLRPPAPVAGRTSAVDLVANSDSWGAFFIIAGALLVFAHALRRRPPARFLLHGLAATVYMAYGFASLAASFINDTGWTGAGLCAVSAAGLWLSGDLP